MKFSNSIAVVAACATLALPVGASAQFGGLGHVLGGGSSAPSPSAASPADGDAFLANALMSTKNVMISAKLLSAALVKRSDKAALKGEIDAIQNMQSFKELGTQKDDLQSNLGAISARGDVAGELTTTYQAADAQEKQLIAIAIANLALGTYRNIKLAGEAPGFVKGFAGNPLMLRRIGEFKMAADLLVIQSKGFATIAPALPKIMTALKVAAPQQSDTTKFQPVAL